MAHDFTITVSVFKYKTAKQPLITITMSDGESYPWDGFANQKIFEPSDENGERNDRLQNKLIEDRITREDLIVLVEK